MQFIIEWLSFFNYTQTKKKKARQDDGSKIRQVTVLEGPNYDDDDDDEGEDLNSCRTNSLMSSGKTSKDIT